MTYDIKILYRGIPNIMTHFVKYSLQQVLLLNLLPNILNRKYLDATVCSDPCDFMVF